jgi:hypothetical protein
MKNLRILGIATLAGLMLAGCAGIAHVEKDQTVNFNSFKTYAWTESKASDDDSSKTGISDLAERKIRDAVNAEMAKTGWKEVKNKPDVLLSYDVALERNIKEESSPVYSQGGTRYIWNPYARRWVPVYYPSRFLGYETDQRNIKEGTFTISMTDTRTDKTVWQGWTTGEVNSANLTTKEIQTAVKSIFRKFDVAKN